MTRKDDLSPESTLAATPLHPEIEHGTGDQQEEHSPYKAPGKDIGLIEVTPGEEDGDNNRRYSDHLALHRTPSFPLFQSQVFSPKNTLFLAFLRLCWTAHSAWLGASVRIRGRSCPLIG